MIPTYRCGTKKAINELAAELNLRFENWMQDWPIEVVSPADIDVYIGHYHKLTDDDKKFVLMQGILDATEYQPTEELFFKILQSGKPNFRSRFSSSRIYNILLHLP